MSDIPKITERIRRGARALKRVAKESNGEIQMHLQVDRDIRDLMTPEEERCLDALIEYETKLFQWMTNDTEDDCFELSPIKDKV